MKNLVTPAWLASHLGAAGLVIFDATKYLPNEPHDGLTKFREAHIPGARFFDLDLYADQELGPLLRSPAFAPLRAAHPPS